MLDRANLDDRLCFRPLDPAIRTASSVVWKKHQTFSKAAELFLNQIRRRAPTVT